MSSTDSGYNISARGIAIFNEFQSKLAELNFCFSAGSQVWTVQSLEESGSGWIGITEDPSVTVEITRGINYLIVELRGTFGPGADVSYFRESPVFAGHVHTFIPDTNLGVFSVAQDQAFTLTNQAAMRQRLGLKEELWMIAPQPHVIAIGSEKAAGFALSIPECLPSDAVQFVFKKRRLQIDFLHHVAACDENRMPRVYVDLKTDCRTEVLNRHLGHARDLGLIDERKVQFDWWHNPLYCTWGDQCRLGSHGISKNESLTAERMLGWTEKIRTFYQGEVNFIIDDGYFMGMGDFRLRPELYASVEEFRELIAELKRRRFKVILWYTPFWVDPSALVVSEHPEWLLHRPDGSIVDETGDWKGKYHFDWTHPELREYQRKLIRHFLTDLDADGFKIDMTYAHPPTRELRLHDPTWAAGNLFCRRVVEFIHREANAIKKDVFLTVNGVESYLQPFVSAVRLNDLFDFSNSTAWYRRAELVNRLMPGVAIDVDGWPAGPAKLREYPFVASVFGAPVTYYLDGTDVGDLEFGVPEINRMASVWAVYDHAPVKESDEVLMDVDQERFERRDKEGRLRALSLYRKVFLAYGEGIRVTANTAMPVAVPLESGAIVLKLERVNRDGSRISVPLYQEENSAVFFAEDAADGILYYELS